MTKKTSESQKTVSRRKKVVMFPELRRLVLRLVSWPGYAAIFTAWVVVIGMAIIGIFDLMPGVQVTSFYDPQPVNEPKADLTFGSIALLFFVAIMFWVIAAHMTVVALRWIEQKLKLGRRNVWTLKMGLLALGWLQTTYIFATLEPEVDFAMYFAGAAAIAIGALSLTAEHWLLRRWHAPFNESW